MNIHLNEVEVSAEAARQWGLDESTVKKHCDIEKGKLEWKKSGRVKLVTRSSMDIVYGTILSRIISGKHRDPFYGCEILIQRGEYTLEELSAAGVTTSILNEVNLK